MRWTSRLACKTIEIKCHVHKQADVPRDCTVNGSICLPSLGGCMSRFETKKSPNWNSFHKWVLCIHEQRCPHLLLHSPNSEEFFHTQPRETDMLTGGDIQSWSVRCCSSPNVLELGPNRPAISGMDGAWENEGNRLCFKQKRHILGVFHLSGPPGQCLHLSYSWNVLKDSNWAAWTKHCCLLENAFSEQAHIPRCLLVPYK